MSNVHDEPNSLFKTIENAKKSSLKRNCSTEIYN